MGYDGKYGRVTTEHGAIPDDEPVIVFRGRDKLLPAVMDAYRQLAIDGGSPQFHVELIGSCRDRITTWQAENPDRVRTPDSERYRKGFPDEAVDA